MTMILLPTRTIPLNKSKRHFRQGHIPCRNSHAPRSNMTANEMPSEAVDWCKTMMDYSVTVPGGKLNRGVTVLAIYSTLTRAQHHKNLTNEEVAKASVPIQAFFFVADDVMDASKTRRGQPCWCQLPYVNKNCHQR